MGGDHSSDKERDSKLSHTRAFDPFRIQAVEFVIQPRTDLVGWDLFVLRGGPCLQRHLAGILLSLVWWELDELVESHAREHGSRDLFPTTIPPFSERLGFAVLFCCQLHPSDELLET